MFAQRKNNDEIIFPSYRFQLGNVCAANASAGTLLGIIIRSIVTGINIFKL